MNAVNSISGYSGFIDEYKNRVNMSLSNHVIKQQQQQNSYTSLQEVAYLISK